MSTPRQTVWSAVSRGVRTPSRLDADLALTVPASAPGIPLPFYFVVTGNDDIAAEELIAWEAGYRFRPSSTLSFDLSLFHNDYDDLQTNEPDEPILVLVPPLPYVVVPSHLDSNMRGESAGGTIVVNWQPMANWRLRAQYAYLDLDLETTPASLDVTSPALAGNSPEHQAALYSFLDLPRDVSVYAGLRYVDELPNQRVPSYVAVDANVAWHFRADAEVSLVVQNLTDDTHPEFEGGTGKLIERSAYLKLRWWF